METTAVLLIDLENFFLGRESLCLRDDPDGSYQFPVDLDSLITMTSSLMGDRRILARRAYANFSDRRPGDGDRRWDYYLQPLPRFLMEQGVEPVQVFRFPGTNNKNASDIRLALDAVNFCEGPSVPDRVILVTGDADFIPLVLELKRRGVEVMVIGVSGSTSPLFRQYCDRFDYFEDLLEQNALTGVDLDQLSNIGECLRRRLETHGLLPFSSIKSVIEEEIGRDFSPEDFGTDSTGAFLRRFSGQLGVSIRRGENDWEAFLPRGNSGAEKVGHSEKLYRDLLRQGSPRCHIVPHADWRVITDLVLELAHQRDVKHADLLNEIAEACADAGMEDSERRVNDVVFQLFKSGCFQSAGGDDGQADFHWSNPARIAEGIESEADAMEQVSDFVVGLLEQRLEQKGLSPRVDPDVLRALMFGPLESANDTGVSSSSRSASIR